MDSIQQFSEYISGRGYAGAFVSNVSIDSGDAVFNLATRIVLCHDAPPVEERSLLNVQLGRFRACRVRLDSSMRGSLAASLKRGHLDLGHYLVEFQGEPGRGFAWTWNRDGASGFKSIGWYAPQLFGTGAHQGTVAGPELLEQLSGNMLS